MTDANHHSVVFRSDPKRRSIDVVKSTGSPRNRSELG
jgi:hypothetical protein